MMSRQSEDWATAWESLKSSRGLGVQSRSEEQWQQAGQMIKDHYNDKELREKALMYAVQSYAASTESFSVTQAAESYLKFLKGGDAK